MSPTSRREAIQLALGRAAERMLVGGTSWDVLLNDFVESLGVACGASRAYVFRHRPERAGTVSQVIAQWSATGDLRRPTTDPVTYEALGLGGWLDRLQAREVVSAVAGDNGAAECAFLRANGIQSMLAVPIHVEGSLWGVVGIDDCVHGHAPRDEEVEALLGASRLIAAAEQRRSLEDQLATQSKALRASELLHRTLVRHFPNGSVSLVDRDLRFVVVDGQGFRDHGVDPTAMIGKTVREALSPELAEQDEPLFLAALRGHDASGRVTYQGRTFDVRVVPVRDDAGDVTHALALVSDITLQIQAEDALREHQQQHLRTQKIEALGRLAGGIAHDFNNLLTVIGTSAELALDTVDESHPAATELAEVRRAAQRGYLLTRQLLAFTRQQPTHDPHLLAVNEVTTSALTMLQRLRGTTRPIGLDLADSAGVVFADRGQFEQVLVNLVVNAIDATVDGGTITVSTQRASAAPYGFDANEAVLLRVRDTGVGIDAETQARVFEPFFTTKPAGHGTGLGLATVFAIVEQAGGVVSIDSTVGRGTTITVALPRRGEEADASPLVDPESVDANNSSETVLVVDDEMAVRASVRRLLVSHGYHVIEAKDGLDALSEIQRHRATVALVLTDVVMPELDGPGLADRLRTDAPELPVIFMSGYARDLLLPTSRVRDESPLIEKPFSGRELLRVIRAGIDRSELPLPHSA
jgi:PAS domain S-box-containing protein